MTASAGAGAGQGRRSPSLSGSADLRDRKAARRSRPLYLRPSHAQRNHPRGEQGSGSGGALSSATEMLMCGRSVVMAPPVVLVSVTDVGEAGRPALESNKLGVVSSDGISADGGGSGEGRSADGCNPEMDWAGGKVVSSTGCAPLAGQGEDEWRAAGIDPCPQVGSVGRGGGKAASPGPCPMVGFVRDAGASASDAVSATDWLPPDPFARSGLAFLGSLPPCFPLYLFFFPITGYLFELAAGCVMQNGFGVLPASTIHSSVTRDKS